MTDSLRSLLDAHRAAAAATSPFEVVQVLAVTARIALRVDAAVVILWDPAVQAVRCVGTQGLDVAAEPRVMRAAAALCDELDAAWTGSTESARTLTADEARGASAQLVAATQSQAVTVVPIADGARYLGLTIAVHLSEERGAVGDSALVSDLRSSFLAELDRALHGDQLVRQALYDAVTELPGDALFASRARQALQARGADEVGVVLVAIEQLSAVSRSLGHTIGNEMLRKVADRLLVSGGAAAWLVGRLRFGGLGILVRGAPGTTAGAADRVVAAFADPLTLGRRSVRATGRVGYAVAADVTLSGAELVQQAETALHAAMLSVRTTPVAYDASMTSSAQRLLALEAALQVALAQGQLLVHYQPQVDVQSGRVVGAEALVRWRRDEATIPPAVFLPAAEATGMIVDIDRWVLGRACGQAREWSDAGLALRVAVNVSSRTLAVPGYADCVRAELDGAGLDPGLLEIEVTETADWTSSEAVDELAALQQLGVHIAIDDFGTGYSTVGRLRTLPIDRVKIDQSFVRDMAGDGGPICEAVLAMARSLDLDVIAEGVETDDQLAFLAAHGCTEIQGYLVSPPVDAAALMSVAVR